MARCSGCSGDRCSCTIDAGAGIGITGAGTIANPFVVSAEGGGSGGSTPTGSLVMFAAVVPPAGWLICDGRAVSRSTYATLYGVIGTKYGAGDGSTTFNLPNLAGRFPFGADATHPNDGVSKGSETVILSAAQVPNHLHTMAHTHSIDHKHAAFYSGSDTPDHGHNGSTDGQGDHAHSYTVGTARAVAAGGAASVIDDVYASPATSVAGNHGHNVSVGGATARHSHLVDIANHVQASGASSTANTGNPTGTVGSPVSLMPPYLAITFLVKT